MVSKKGEDIYIVDGARTPFLKAKNGLGPFSASDLAVKTGRQLLSRFKFSPTEIDEVIIGSALPSPDEGNIGRIIALRLGCGDKVPAWTVMRNCASGMQSLDNAFQSIALSRSQLVLAGGTDAMSHAPLLFNAKMVNWLGAFYAAKSFSGRAKLLSQFRPSFLAPVIALLRGLTDPIIALNMGQTAENIAYHFDITRQEMDAFAARSHERLLNSTSLETEITPIIDNKGNVYRVDDGARTDSTPEKLAKLRPFFDKKYGMVTAGNSSQITDGAALLLLASKEAVKKHNLPVLARIVDTEWAALSPKEMGLGPVHAATPLLQRHKLGLSNIDYWEINEAFAAQVLGCIHAWKDKTYCKNHLGLDKPFGELDESKLNIDGGAIACGHPIGASGARIVLHLAKKLQEKKGSRGVASICIGGGQGGAFLMEQVDGVA
jgi:acetyl-CoA C-acetyltransferase